MDVADLMNWRHRIAKAKGPARHHVRDPDLIASDTSLDKQQIEVLARAAAERTAFTDLICPRSLT